MPRIRSVEHPHLSLWQSAVSETLLASESARNVVDANQWLAAQPAMRAADEHAGRAFQLGGKPLSAPGPSSAGNELEELVWLSDLAQRAAEAELAGNQSIADALWKQIREFSSLDVEFVRECVGTYLRYRTRHAEPEYRDWKKLGKPIESFGVMPYELENDAKVAILGDWGTGLSDAKALLRQVVREHRPSVIIHLGDTYYSGTPSECQRRVVDLFDAVFREELDGDRIPVVAIPGNHEYYAFGFGFHEMLDELNPRHWRQEASYFCLRTADGRWQFLGMDTGRNDFNPVWQESSPGLQPSESEWQLDKLDGFDGSTILLSHHQLFSQHHRLGSGPRPWLNEKLYATFHRDLARISAWFWGHEHNLGIFKNGLFNLRMGRLVGCSAYEEAVAENPYDPLDEPFARNVPYRKPTVRLDSDDGYFHHAYAVIDLKREKPTDDVKVSYFQIPSWGSQERERVCRMAEVDSEPIEAVREGGDDVVRGGDRFYLEHQSGRFFASADGLYPRLANRESGAIQLEFRGVPRDKGLRSQDVVQLMSREDSLLMQGGKNVLGAWTFTHRLYYWILGHHRDKQGWEIIRMPPRQATDSAGDRTDGTIRFGDAVVICNVHHDQYLCESSSWPGYVTTVENDETVWYITKVPYSASEAGPEEGAPRT